MKWLKMIKLIINKLEEGFFVELGEYKHLIEEMQSAVDNFRGSL